MIRKVSDLEVFNLSYTFAMDIFRTTRSFPREARYSLTDQIIRSSRSIAANTGEGFGKRVYESEFKKHLTYTKGSIEETKIGYCLQRIVDISKLTFTNHIVFNMRKSERSFINFLKTGRLLIEED